MCVCVCRTRSFSLSLFSLCASTHYAATAAEASIPTRFTAGSHFLCQSRQPTDSLSLSLALSQTRSAPAAEAAGNQTNTARAANHHVFEASAAQNNTAMLTHALHTNTPHSLAAVHIHTLHTSTTFKVVSHYVQLGYKAGRTGTQLTWLSHVPRGRAVPSLYLPAVVAVNTDVGNGLDRGGIACSGIRKVGNNLTR